MLVCTTFKKFLAATKSSIERLLYVLNKSVNLQDQITRRKWNLIRYCWYLSQVAFCCSDIYVQNTKAHLCQYYTTNINELSKVCFSLVEEKKKTLGNTWWNPHQFSLIRPKTQRHAFPRVQIWELPQKLFANPVWMGEKVLGSTSLPKPGGRGEALLGIQKFSLLSCYEQLS